MATQLNPPVDVDRALELLARARAEVSALCKGRGRVGGRDWTMCIPVQEDDSDVVLSSALRAAEDCIRTLRDLAYTPGQWVCDQCGYFEIKHVVSAIDGGIRASKEPALPCPNDGAPMRPCSWREIAKERAELLDQYRRERTLGES